ncbi:MAG: bifunctional (p)ppGpp synthetase/guanosine-3',5'-bis(diphosphate) 3'-pyrophosphohydrolase, partial [Alistipes sp.]|nr:bifunctional (p)ppGpp synthetase/guanosine-3',5'-bis(diphosphate) 3'-pyrophosphohydrolase [Alistipes sp.]
MESENSILGADLTARYSRLIDFVRENYSQQTLQSVEAAIFYAARHTADEHRYDGTPMLDHAVEVARIATMEIGLGRNSTVAAIIHDAVRLTVQSNDEKRLTSQLTEIGQLFGREVVGITIGLANISELKLNMEQEQASNFRDMIVSYSEDPRVILIKLADRLEVMRSIAMFPAEKQQRKSWESMNLYAQLAHKLGLYKIKSELEDLSLAVLERDDYQHISDKLRESESQRMDFIARFIEPIEQQLRQVGIRYHIKSRTKSIYSIWNKMRKQEVDFEGVYDIFAIRIIIDCEPSLEKMQCWTVYSIVSVIPTRICECFARYL